MAKIETYNDESSAGTNIEDTWHVDFRDSSSNPDTRRPRLVSRLKTWVESLMASWAKANSPSGSVPVNRGGTGSTSASGARTNLGLRTAATRNTGTGNGTVPLIGSSGVPPQVLSNNDPTTVSGDYQVLEYDDDDAEAARWVNAIHFTILADNTPSDGDVLGFVSGQTHARWRAEVTGTSIPAQDSAPSDPSEGDLWVDTTDDTAILKVREGSSWKQVGGASGTTVAVQDSAPSDASEGDLWVDTTGSTTVLKVYNGSSWATVGSGITQTAGDARYARLSSNTLTNNLTIERSGDNTALNVEATDGNNKPTMNLTTNDSGSQKAFQMNRDNQGLAFASFEGTLGGDNNKPGFSLGSGSGGRDVALYRDAANVLRTPDALHVNELRVNSGGALTAVHSLV